MKNHTMFIASKHQASKAFNYVLLSMITILAIMCVLRLHNARKELKTTNIFFASSVTSNDNAIVYVPNAFLNQLITNGVINSKISIYDKSIYDFYELKYANTIGLTKVFTLSVIKKNSIVTVASNSKVLNAQLQNYYSPSNIIKKDITLKYEKNAISVITTDVNNEKIELYNSHYDNLNLKLIDPSFQAYEYNGNTMTTFSNNGIIIGYTNDITSNTNLIKYLDGSSRFQNLGISIALPFNFINNFTSKPQNRLYFKSGSSTFGDLKLKGLNLTHSQNDKIKAGFAIDSDNPLVPASLSVIATLDKSSNRLEGVENYSYNPANLTPSQIKRMELFINNAKKYINTELINSILAPRIEGDILEVTSINLHHKLVTGSGNSSYFDDYLISTINLHL